MKTYIENGLTFANLNEMTRAFLNIYVPKNEHTTSFAEMKMIEKMLDLRTIEHEELTYLRNAVVKYYSDERKDMERNSQEEMNKWQAMLSITATIDNVIYGG